MCSWFLATLSLTRIWASLSGLTSTPGSGWAFDCVATRYTVEYLFAFRSFLRMFLSYIPEAQEKRTKYKKCYYDAKRWLLCISLNPSCDQVINSHRLPGNKTRTN